MIKARNSKLKTGLSAYALYQKDNDIARVRIAVDKRFWRPLS
jgi:hypothetical protein